MSPRSTLSRNLRRAVVPFRTRAASSKDHTSQGGIGQGKEIHGPIAQLGEEIPKDVTESEPEEGPRNPRMLCRPRRKVRDKLYSGWAHRQ